MKKRPGPVCHGLQVEGQPLRGVAVHGEFGHQKSEYQQRIVPPPPVRPGGETATARRRQASRPLRSSRLKPATMTRRAPGRSDGRGCIAPRPVPLAMRCSSAGDRSPTSAQSACGECRVSRLKCDTMLPGMSLSARKSSSLFSSRRGR